MPKFSIVLPTVDRPQILKAVLVAALDMAPANCEIVVSDNYSDDETARALNGFSDRRLRIIRTSERLSLSDHWEWIWPQLSGDYVIYTCDDCVLLPAAFAAAEMAIAEYDAEIISWRVAHYYHPDWDIQYAHLPTRGNIVGLSADFSNRFFRVNSHKVLREFTKTLRLAGGFPGVVNFMVKRALADQIRDRTGSFWWAPAPDISASTLALALAKPGGYVLWDGLGALGGRSRDSNLAGVLSRGRRTNRVREWLDEYSDAEQRFPLHEIQIESLTNILAAALTQAQKLLPELSEMFDYALKTLVMRSIDDAFFERTVQEVGFSTFLSQLDSLINQLDPEDRSEALKHREAGETFAQTQDEVGAQRQNPTPEVRRRDLLKLYVRLLKSRDPRVRRLRRVTKRNPIDRYWAAGGEDFIDMRLFGGSTIADVSRALPTVLKEFATEGPVFSDSYQEQGILEPLNCTPYDPPEYCS